MARGALAATVVVTAVAGLMSPSGLTVLTCGTALCVIILLLWREDDPPVLLLPALFQWSEVAIWPYATAWRGTSLGQQSAYGADLEGSTLYALLGVLALVLGMRMTGRKSISGLSFAERLRLDAQRRTFNEIALLAAVAILGGYLMAAAGRLAGSLGQIVAALSQVKYVGLFLLCYWCLYHERKIAVMLAVVIFDVLVGLTGFFAEFKNTVLTIFVAAIASRRRVRPTDAVVVGVATVFILNLAVFWSAIKPDYRTFLNQGSEAQEVTVPLSWRLSYLIDRSMQFDSQDWGDGLERLVDRHGYTEFLGLAMTNVPANRPHENGRLTWQAATHFAVPRLIWPGKPPLPNDTDHMVEYTGLPNLWEENTSISIGYLGDLYIDFGWLGGLLAAGMLGALVGACYRRINIHAATSPLVSAGLGVMLVLPICYFGTAYLKLFGALTVTIIAVFFVQKWALPWLRRLTPMLVPV